MHNHKELNNYAPAIRKSFLTMICQMTVKRLAKTVTFFEKVEMKTILVCFCHLHKYSTQKLLIQYKQKNVQEVLEPIQKFYKPCTLLFWGRISRGRRPRNLSKEWIQHFIIVSFCNTKMKYTQ